MGGFVLAGCLMIAFGIPFSVFVNIIAKKAQLVIVCLISAFFWLTSATFTAICWFAVPPFQDSSIAVLVIFVLFIEVGRYFFFQQYAKAERSFSVVSTNAIAFPMIDFYSALAAGVGFATIHTVLLHGTIILGASGPGTLYADTCPYLSEFLYSAIMGCLYGVLHIIWMILAFDAYRRKNKPRGAVVIVSHYIAAAMLIRDSPLGYTSCVSPIINLALVLLVTGAFCMYVIRQGHYRSRARGWAPIEMLPPANEDA